ncbi:hypothetical protein [Candidatus Odyssella acanthamoebae]|uniref:Uncharacterized protein n=1 Tax=Candidatus Odyssella acanthamoebae TaxID=91604 RepID=A0A077AZV9_9PROT|nr:hypothetical protein [Candidatus Paracaedibacter acanthamoebae]AIK96245.1 hypothetical protein ID47_05040 [Candidatus Paracaedibacter acanthamoebae]
MIENNQMNFSSLIDSEWQGMAQDALTNSDLSDHPALMRLQTYAMDHTRAELDMGRYSRMHHRHNR